jgi:renal tumor antigen
MGSFTGTSSRKRKLIVKQTYSENILLLDDQIKLADFGSCRGIYSKQPYTEYISTRWYRAPECLLTDGYYGYKMDLWGVGCVLFEVLSLFPLFPGNDELD